MSALFRTCLSVASRRQSAAPSVVGLAATAPKAAAAAAAAAAAGRTSRVFRGTSCSLRRTYFSDTLSVAPLNRVELAIATTARVLTDVNGRRISPWHDVPLRVAGTDGAVCYAVAEAGRGSQARFRVDTSSEGNPLVQGLGTDGKARRLHFAALTNLCVLPQTYAGGAMPSSTGRGGPLSVCEIGATRAEPGHVYPVRVLGSLPVPLVGGAVEWHILAARLSDPLAESLRGRPLSEAPPAVARLLEALQLWLTSATAAAHGHGGANASRSTTVGSSGAIWHGRDDTLAQVNDAHAAWRQLIADGKDATKRRLYGEADVAKYALAPRPWTPPSRWAIPTDLEGRLKAASTSVQPAIGVVEATAAH